MFGCNDAEEAEVSRAPRDMNELTLKLKTVERLRGASRERMKQRLGWSHTLIAVTYGEVLLELEREAIELARGSVYWIEPETTYGFESLGGDIDIYLFQFELYRVRHSEEESGAAIEPERGIPTNERLFVGTPDQLASFCDGIWRRWSASGPLSVFRCQIDLQELLYGLLTRSRQKPDNSLAALEYVHRYMEEHYAEPLSIDKLARLADLSPKYFVDLFKKRYGVSAMEHLAELRLRQAMKLMSQSKMKLRDIAHRVGYADEFYFSRKFKKQIGVSPTVYMENRSSRLAVYSPELIGMLLPLGVVPYAAPLHPKWTEYYYRELRDEIPVHLNANRRHRPWRENVERLKQASVDRILAVDTASAEEREALERIAPVEYIPAASDDWQKCFLDLACMLGEEWQARRWLGEYDCLMRESRARLCTGLNEETVAIVRMTGQRLTLHCNRGMRNVLYDGLGLTPARFSGQESYDVPITLGGIETLRPGRLLLLIRQDSETLEEWRYLQQNTGWQRIDAVRSGRTGMLPSDPWREYSAHAHWRMLEQAVRMLSGEHP